MAANIADYFGKYSNGSQPIPTTLSAQKLAGATTASLTTATGWDTTTVKHVRMYTTTVSGSQTIPNQSSICIYKATLSGTTLSNLTLVWSATGSDQTYAAGATVDLAVTPGFTDAMSTGMLVEHNQNGTHAAITATSVASTGAVSGTTITGTSLVSTGDVQLRSTSLETIASERFFDHVASGCVWSGDAYGSTRAASMTSGVVYINGKRVTIAAVTARSFTASKDTYIDVDNTGTITYTEVANNAASPALSANNIRLGIIVTGASNIANVGSVNQGEETKVLPIASSVPYSVTDSLGNLICPRDPNRKILGIRQRSSSFSTTATTATQITELSAPVIVPTGRKIRVRLTGENAYHSSANVSALPGIWEGTVGSGTLCGLGRGFQAGGSGVPSLTVERTYTPTSTNITINGSLHGASAGTSIIDGGTVPMVLVVELA